MSIRGTVEMRHHWADGCSKPVGRGHGEPGLWASRRLCRSQEVMLRIHLMQNRDSLSDEAMENNLLETYILKEILENLELCPQQNPVPLS